MIYINNSLPLTNSFSSPFHCFLDLETTGLSKQHDSIICFGLAYVKEETLYIEQYLIENKDEEQMILEQLIKTLVTFEKIYTYGGKYFDWPFIIEKLHTYNLDSSFLTTLQLIDLKQKKSNRSTLETRIGFKRTQTITGKELAKIGKLHMVQPHATYKTLIIEHNKEELLSLQKIFDFTQFILHLSPRHLTKHVFDEIHLTFTLAPSKLYPYSFSIHEEDFLFSFDAHTNLITLSIEAQKLTLKTYLPPKDYYLVEGQLMHKSLAKLLPASMRQKVTKQNCYLQQEDLYLPLVLDELKTLSWVDDMKQSYTPYHPDQLEPYVLPLLKIVLKKIRSYHNL